MMNSHLRTVAPTRERDIEELESKTCLRSRTYLTPKSIPTNRKEKDLGHENGVRSL
jgi:hypothetical protein